MAQRIGAMRERVTLQAEVMTADGGGGASIVWSSVASCWARVRPLGGREQAARGGQDSAQLYEVTIRKPSASVTTAQRLMWGSVSMNIKSIVNFDERGEYLTLTAESGVVV